METIDVAHYAKALKRSKRDELVALFDACVRVWEEDRHVCHELPVFDLSGRPISDYCNKRGLKMAESFRSVLEEGFKWAYHQNADGVLDHLTACLVIVSELPVFGRRWRADRALLYLNLGDALREDQKEVDILALIEINGGTFMQGRHSRGSGMAADYEKGNFMQAYYKCPMFTFDTTVLHNNPARVVATLEAIVSGAQNMAVLWDKQPATPASTKVKTRRAKKNRPE
jgi:hypothetical protein